MLKKKNIKDQQRNKSYKEESVGILELKNTVTTIKSSVDRFNSRMERVEEEVSEWKDRKTAMTLSDQWREKNLKQNHGEDPGLCGTRAKKHIFLLSQSWKEK